MKYKVYRSLGDLDKQVKKHTLIAVEYGKDIYDVTPALVKAVTDELINSPEYDKCDAWANAPEEIGSFRRVKRYNYEMLGVVSPPNAPENILIDFGTAAEGNMGEFWRCDRRFVVGSFSEWQQESFREFEMGNRVSGRKSWKSLAVFGSEETRKEFKRRYRIETERIPFSADAFAVTEECGKFFGKIIAEK